MDFWKNKLKTTIGNLGYMYIYLHEAGEMKWEKLYWVFVLL